MHKVNILFLSSVPEDKEYLEVHRECITMEDGIKSGRYGAMFKRPFEREWNVNVGNLTDLLLKYQTQADVIHFSGHGLATGIFINDKKGSAQFVSADVFRVVLIKTKVKARLVVLNTCHSDEQAQAIADIIGCAVGTPDSLPDELAIQFSASFYRNLAYDFSIREAFDLALVDLRLLNPEESKYPRLFNKNNIDPSDVYLIRRIGRKLIHDINAWNGFVSVLGFAKQIHHMFQTITVMHLPDLLTKLVDTGEPSGRGNIVKRNEAQKKLRTAWDLYEREYDLLTKELVSLSPNYKQAIFKALNTLNDANTDNPDVLRLVEKCKKNTVAIIGEATKQGEFDNYAQAHTKMLEYMKLTKNRQLCPSESIVASVQDMEQFASALTISSDNIIQRIISILLLDSGE